MEKPERSRGAVRSSGAGAVPAVIFIHWREVLNQAPVTEAARAGYSLDIGGYLDYCRHNGLSVTLERARGYMADAQRRHLARNPELWKQALNWFFQQGRKTSGLLPQGVPSLGRADTGRTDWERRLVERLRAHRDRVRGLHEADRGEGLAGVWLPEALERKYPGAGVSWEWFWLFPSRQAMRDPHSGLLRRHHVLDASFHVEGIGGSGQSGGFHRFWVLRSVPAAG